MQIATAAQQRAGMYALTDHFLAYLSLSSDHPPGSGQATRVRRSHTQVNFSLDYLLFREDLYLKCHLPNDSVIRPHVTSVILNLHCQFN